MSYNIALYIISYMDLNGNIGQMFTLVAYNDIVMIADKRPNDCNE